MSKDNEASIDGYVPSRGAQAWVDMMHAARYLIHTISDDDLNDVMGCLREMWTGNELDAAIAKEALCEIIDDPKFNLLRMDLLTGEIVDRIENDELDD